MLITNLILIASALAALASHGYLVFSVGHAYDAGTMTFADGTGDSLQVHVEKAHARPADAFPGALVPHRNDSVREWWARRS